MQKIEAIIRPQALERVRQALAGPWIRGLTISQVSGAGRQKGHTELYRGAEYAVDLVPKLRLELVVPDGLVPRTIDLIRATARSGRIGDGKIFVIPVDQALRIRTGEIDEDAL